jgi:hypothetical protein
MTGKRAEQTEADQKERTRKEFLRNKDPEVDPILVSLVRNGAQEFQ